MKHTLWKPHYIEYSIQLVVVIRITGLYVFLPAVKYWLGRQQFSEDAPNRPYVWKQPGWTIFQGLFRNIASSREMWWAHRRKSSSTRMSTPAEVQFNKNVRIPTNLWPLCNVWHPEAALALCTRKSPPRDQDRPEASEENWTTSQIPCRLKQNATVAFLGDTAHNFTSRNVHVQTYFDSSSLWTFAHDQNIGRFLKWSWQLPLKTIKAANNIFPVYWLCKSVKCGLSQLTKSLCRTQLECK